MLQHFFERTTFLSKQKPRQHTAINTTQYNNNTQLFMVSLQVAIKVLKCAEQNRERESLDTEDEDATNYFFIT